MDDECNDKNVISTLLAILFIEVHAPLQLPKISKWSVTRLLLECCLHAHTVRSLYTPCASRCGRVIHYWQVLYYVLNVPLHSRDAVAGTDARLRR